MLRFFMGVITIAGLLCSTSVGAQILYLSPDSQQTVDALARSWRGTTLPWSRLKGYTRGPLAPISVKGRVPLKSNLDPYPWFGKHIRVEFPYDSAALRPAVKRQLDEIGWVLINPAINDRSILIEGHTDSDGTEIYNDRLSFLRAQAVKNYLVKHFRITARRIRVAGYGEADPLLPNTTEFNKQTNRRAALKIPPFKLICGRR